ncbi:DUF1636 family protein [Gymnodinialimonas ceratoperidinii]|uniref:DUF1636 domain-containing protein n=1 Tax=Gymnodinialimonas ceratoperidinii TaxID=2856823 RepID=A0A8F6U0G0_9RHOB|nr:DUF1636 family protein [Gymnodinialimonas ceratoperidinii]QXT41102.1 DUF1636 domain-containing protein [Gymnodinialimonas ceratoperidinii]
MSPAVVLHLCSTCDPSGFSGARDGLQAALSSAGIDAAVVAQPCMNACAAPVSLALQGAGRATYFFGGIDPEADLADIVATVKCYLASPEGWIEDATACGRLRHCLKGRIPALPRG